MTRKRVFWHGREGGFLHPPSWKTVWINFLKILYTGSNACPKWTYAKMKKIELVEIMRWLLITPLIIIYHPVVQGTREYHFSVLNLQSRRRLLQSWMLKIMDTTMGFASPSHNKVIHYFISIKQTWKGLEAIVILIVFCITFCDVIIVWHNCKVEAKFYLQCHVYNMCLGWVRLQDLATGKFLRSQSKEGVISITIYTCSYHVCHVCIENTRKS